MAFVPWDSLNPQRRPTCAHLIEQGDAIKGVLAALLCALSSAAWSQGLTASPVDVRVVNPVTDPVPTLLARTPVRGYCQAVLTPHLHLFTVPAGQRLVVETVGYFLTVSPSNTINRLSFGKTYPDPVIAIAPGVYPVAVSQTSATDSSRRYAGAQTLIFHLEPGEGLSAYFGSDGGSNFLQEVVVQRAAFHRCAAPFVAFSVRHYLVKL